MIYIQFNFIRNTITEFEATAFNFSYALHPSKVMIVITRVAAFSVHSINVINAVQSTRKKNR